MHFAAEAWLLALASAPLLVVLLRWRDSRVRRALARLFGARAARHVEGAAVRWRPWRRFLLVAGVACLSLALGRPQWGAHELVVRERGTDLVVAFDVSNSMLAADVTPSRIARARGALDIFLGSLDRGRVGLVLFAGAAYVQCPLTLDLGTARQFLRQAEPDMITAQGTSLAQALATSRALLERGGGAAAGAARRAIVLVTDGEDFEGGWESEAQACREAGVVVLPVAVGDPRGGLIPITDDRGRSAGYLKDDEGRVVLTRPEQATLTRLAELTGGAVLTIGQSGLDPVRLRALIARLGQRDLDERRIAAYEERFQWPLALALLCLALRELLHPRRRGVGRVAGAHALGALALMLALATAGSALASPLRPAGAAQADRARALGEQGRWEEALREFETARALNPDDPRLALGVGTALTNLGRVPEAVSEFRRAAALAAEPRVRADALYDGGTALLAQKDADAGAADLLRESLALDPGRDDALRNLEVALRRLAQPPQASQSGGQDQEGDESAAKSAEGQQQPPPEGQTQPSAQTPPPDGGNDDGRPRNERRPGDDQPDGDRDRNSGDMSREQALELLRALDRDEAELRRSVQKRLQGQPEGSGKRW